MARGWQVAGGVIAGLTLVGLGVLLFRVGLDDADKWASVIGVFAALLGLGLSEYGVVLTRRAPQPGPRDSDVQVSASGVRSIAAKTISGSVSTGDAVLDGAANEGKTSTGTTSQADPAPDAEGHRSPAETIDAPVEVRVTASGERSIAAQIISGSVSTGDGPSNAEVDRG